MRKATESRLGLLLLVGLSVFGCMTPPTPDGLSPESPILEPARNDPQNECDSTSYNPSQAEIDFVRAAGEGNHAIVLSSLAEGVDVNAHLTYGDMALAKAAAGGYTDIVRILIEAGADTDCTRCGIDSTTMSNRYIRGAALQYAAIDGSVDIVDLLIQAGATIDATDSNGNTALMWSAYYLKVPVIEMLIEAGADVQYRNPDGETAIDWARQEIPFSSNPKDLEKVEVVVSILSDATMIR